MGGLWRELKRRNVFRVAMVYLAVAWLLTQVVSILAQSFSWPPIVMQVLIIGLVVGFPVVLVVAWLFELTPEGMKATSGMDGAQSIRPITGRKLDRILIGVLACLVVVLLAGQFYFDRPLENAQPGLPGEPSIAVLPFQNFSSDADQGYFADGISEEILNSLAQVNGLKVISRTSSFSFKDKNEDMREIGRALNVATILEGSVRKAGDRVRITAQLVNTADGGHYWSKTYDRELNDIFAVQEDIARAVTQTIGITLGVGEAFRVPGMTRNVEAYDEYLRGQLHTLIPTSSGSDIAKSLAHLERAVALDPDFAQAWDSLAGIYSAAAAGVMPITIDGARGKAEAASARWVALLPDSPLILIQRARDARLQDKEEIYQDAAAKAAGNSALEVVVAQQYGEFLKVVGRMKEAIGQLERAKGIDPLNSDLSFQLGDAYASAGNGAAALAEFDRGLTIGGNEENLVGTALLTALAVGDRPEIDKRLRALATVPSGTAFIPAIHARMGALLDDPEKAVTELKHMAADPQADSPLVQWAIIPQWAAPLGDPAYALAALRSMPSAAQLGFAFALWRPIYRDMRKLPGFRDMVRDLGFVDYWRQSGHWGDYCHPLPPGNGSGDDFECA